MIHPSGRKLCALELVRLFRARPLVACYHRDARRSQESYQNFDEEGFPRSQLHPSYIGEPMEQREESEACFDYLESRQRSTIGQGLGWGNVSFGSFSLRQRK